MPLMASQKYATNCRAKNTLPALMLRLAQMARSMLNQ
jgi:hypothetical protein